MSVRTLWIALGATVCVMLVAASSGTSAQPPTVRSLIAPGAKVEVFASGLLQAEGPLWLRDGRLIVSEIGGNDVLAIDAAGKKREFRRSSNYANGHALAPDGSVVEAESGRIKPGLIARIAPNGSVSAVLADDYRGKRFNAPNDLIVKRDGTIWFTDPHYGELVQSKIGFNGVYRLDPRTKAATLMTKTLLDPNGIAFSPDQKTLYVSDSDAGDGTVYAFPVAANDTLGPGKRFGRGCDGIAVDERGDVWASMCSNQIAITDPAGSEIGTVRFPGTTTNLAWGGADGKTLFVTTEDGGVYSLALTVRETH